MQEYLSVLYNKLSFIDKKERDNIISEIKNKIEDELGNGKKLSTILKEIGTTDDVVKKICKEKKLNYDYYTNTSSFDKRITNISSNVATFTRDIIKVINNKVYGSTLEGFLSNAIKILIFLLICLVFRIPFIAFDSLMEFFNEFLFYPFNTIFDNFTNVLLNLIYFVICIVWLLKIFGNTTKKEKKIIDKEEISNKVDKDYKSLDLIIKVVLYLFILIPLALIVIANIILLFFSTFLVVKGIKVAGLIVLFTGLLILNGILFTMVKDSLYNKTRNYSLVFAMAIIITLSGMLFSVINISSFKTPKTLELSYSKPITEEIKLELKDINSKIIVPKGKVEILEDNSLAENEIKAQVTYYDDYVDVVYAQEQAKEINYITFKTIKDKKPNYNVIIKNFFKDLQKGYMFNYNDSNNISIKIYANYNTKKVLESNNK